MDLILLGIILPWLFVGLGCWLGYQLVRQNGRILLRLEALELRLDEAAAAAGRCAAMPAPARPIHEGLPVGDAAPAWELPDLAGDRHSLSELAGRKALLIFFNPGCGFCARMAPDLARLPVDGAEGRPVPLVLTVGDAERNCSWVAEHDVRAIVLLDEKGEAARAYAANGTPTGYLIDEEGRIASPLAVGAPSLLDLADGKAPLPLPAHHNGNGHGPKVGTRDLSNSRIGRQGLEAGTLAPDFRLPALNGVEFALSDLRGQPVLLVFSDPHCGPCDALMPELEARYRAGIPLQGATASARDRSRRGKGQDSAPFHVLMVSRGGVEENQEKARHHGLTFPVVLQKKWEISRLYALFATPVGYLIDAEGRVAAPAAQGAAAILDLLVHSAAAGPAAVAERAPALDAR